jgi:hypothetical protein
MDVVSSGVAIRVGRPNPVNLHAGGTARNVGRRPLVREYRMAAFNAVPAIPLGQHLPHAAWRSSLTGLLKGSAPVFCGVGKA